MASRRSFMLGGAAYAAGAWSVHAQAQGSADYPSRAVTIMSTSQAGGGLDLLARLVAEKMAASWGQPVVVEPRPGANGMIAAGAVSRARPDGYTLLISNSSVVQNTILYPQPSYRLDELMPVSQVVQFPIALAVRSDIAANSVEDLVRLAKANPGKLSFGSYGAGSSGHLLGETLKREAGVYMLHVPYRGEPPLLNALVGAEIDAAFASVGGLARQRSSGKMRMLAVASSSRLKDFPDLPTFQEAGFPSVSVPGWAGMFAPAGCPPAVAQKVAEEVRRIVGLPDVLPKLTGALGALPVGMQPEEFRALIAREHATWASTIKAAGIKLE